MVDPISSVVVEHIQPRYIATVTLHTWQKLMPLRCILIRSLDPRKILPWQILTIQYNGVDQYQHVQKCMYGLMLLPLQGHHSCCIYCRHMYWRSRKIVYHYHTHTKIGAIPLPILTISLWSWSQRSQFKTTKQTFQYLYTGLFFEPPPSGSTVPRKWVWVGTRAESMVGRMSGRVISSAFAVREQCRHSYSSCAAICPRLR